MIIVLFVYTHTFVGCGFEYRCGWHALMREKWARFQSLYILSLDAVMLSLAFCEAVDNPEATLPYKISAMAKEAYDRNFHILKVITKAIILCGKQNIPLRGHRDDYTSVATNKGNFIAILQTLSENDEIMMHTLSMAREMLCAPLKLLKMKSLRYLLATLGRLQSSSAVFSIIADEVTDKHANKEILAVCLRFESYGEIQELFFDFVELERADGAHIAEAIVQNLKSNNINILKCRGQAYDGASAMVSEKVRVQARIRTISLYTHCRSHVLNLSIASACTIPIIRNMIGVINEVF